MTLGVHSKQCYCKAQGCSTYIYPDSVHFKEKVPGDENP